MRDRLIELLENADETVMGFTIDGDVSVLADHLLAEGVIVLPCLREWNSDGLWCGYELLYDDKGTFTVVHFGKSQKEDAIKIFKEIKAEKALAERSENGK